MSGPVAEKKAATEFLPPTQISESIAFAFAATIKTSYYAPVFFSNQPISFDSVSSQQLACQCSRLITSVTTAYPKLRDYQLCFKPIVKDWLFEEKSSDYPTFELTNEVYAFIRFSPSVWYSEMKDSPESKAERALRYLEVQRAQFSYSRSYPEADELFLRDDLLPDYCWKGNRCSHFGSCMEYHSLIVPACQGSNRTKSHTTTMCNWMCQEELILQQLSMVVFPEMEQQIRSSFKQRSRFPVPYVLISRAEATREILILPNPAFNDQSDFHFDNSLLACSEAFWQFSLHVMNTIKSNIGVVPEQVYFNFGEWETAISRNRYLKECHGHLHLMFSVADMRELGLFDKSAAGRYADVEDHAEKDCDSLDRIIPSRIRYRTLVESIVSAVMQKMELKGAPSS